jgi:hypothetical protein
MIWKPPWQPLALGVVGAMLAGGLVATSGAAHPPGGSHAPGPLITVYKNASCGCCKKWIEHVRAAGFQVEAHDTAALAAIMDHYGVPKRLAACHTAVVDGYVIEGHVPADIIARLLKERPPIAGIAVPGMPAGSPGMDSPTPARYAIVTFDQAGRTSVYAHR